MTQVYEGCPYCEGTADKEQLGEVEGELNGYDIRRIWYGDEPSCYGIIELSNSGIANFMKWYNIQDKDEMPYVFVEWNKNRIQVSIGVGPYGDW